ncbi:MAG: tyrosine-type recombinase/integrase [Eggerthellaceae bacterium]|nr:tyrosine-type recombinase/integrase [Eggerthellaceae bacterium]
MAIPVDQIAEKALLQMAALGYSASTITHYRSYFNCISKQYSQSGCSLDAIKKWAEKTTASNGKPFKQITLYARKKVVSIILDYISDGVIDLSPRRTHKNHPLLSSSELNNSLAAFDKQNRDKGLSEATRTIYLRLAKNFCFYLETTLAIDEIDKIIPQNVLGFISFMTKKWPGADTEHILTNFRPYLKFLGKTELIDSLKLIRSYKNHPIIDVLEESEERALIEVCKSDVLTYRDRAVVLISLTLGLRGTDIAELTLKSLDWRTFTIHICQHKTKEPISLPMVPMLAECLAHYLLEERPDAPTDRVFITHNPPYRPLTGTASVSAIIRRAAHAAGLNKNASAHLLRHNIASKMVCAGTEFSVVSGVLGHKNPFTTKGYITTDMEGLSLCILDDPLKECRS